jgi:DNA-3-methyladenine glycosylase
MKSPPRTWMAESGANGWQYSTVDLGAVVAVIQNWQQRKAELISNVLKRSSIQGMRVSSGQEPGLRTTDFASLAPLPRGFYDRDPRRVSRELLGKVLIRSEGSLVLAARVVEVEAYLGNDPAAHCFAGRTERNAVLWGPPGFAYVYFIYGNHFCFNVSCLPDGVAGGVLFRALEPLLGISEMAQARGASAGDGSYDLRQLTSGPGRLAEAFGITRPRDNGKDLTSPVSDLWIAEDGSPRPQVKITPRIGITKAAERRLRYIIPGNRFVSGRKT